MYEDVVRSQMENGTHSQQDCSRNKVDSFHGKSVRKEERIEGGKVWDGEGEGVVEGFW